MAVQKYPIGIQSFSEIRQKGFMYVDKTMYIPMLMDWGKYFFLGRPRRFGKSLFISTMQAYFEGRKDLFDGLAVAEQDKNWDEYPVLHIDFTGQNYTANDKTLDSTLSHILENWEREFDCPIRDENLGIRFENVIRNAYEKTGRQVVILIDEYDKPLLDTIEYPKIQEKNRNTLRGVYGNLKKMDPYIKLAFLTGITRFGKLSVFSDLNNLKDISMVREFSGICGITSEELHRYFSKGVEAFAESEECSIDEMYETLKANYDGYHFSPTGSPDIYNPFSLLNALQDRDVREYWYSTGTPQFLAKRIKSQALDIKEMNKVKVTQEEIQNIQFDMKGDPVPILYQAGYLTIKDFDRRTRIITLGYPNREVERGFLNQLMNVYAPSSANRTAFSIIKFIDDVENGNTEDFMQRLKVLFASINYDSFDLQKIEQHYRNAIYLLFKLLGYYCHAEYRTADGRIDMVVETDSRVYLFEFKLDKTAEEAMAQIDSKDYLLPFHLGARNLVKIGANFSSAKKNLDAWLIG